MPFTVKPFAFIVYVSLAFLAAGRYLAPFGFSIEADLTTSRLYLQGGPRINTNSHARTCRLHRAHTDTQQLEARSSGFMGWGTPHDPLLPPPSFPEKDPVSLSAAAAAVTTAASVLPFFTL
eukprot:399181-Amphidinium_carterae.1